MTKSKKKGKKEKMKTSLRKFLTFVIVLCVAFIGFISAAKVNAASYTETTFGEGKFLITTTFDGSTYYLPATTTSSGPLAATFTDVTTISEDHLWTVTATGSNYYIQNNAGKYLYTTATNNGVRVGDTQRAWKYDSSANSFQDTSTSRYLGIYNASNWRCYTSVTQSNYKESSTSFKFYKLEEGAKLVSVAVQEGGKNYAKVDSTIALQATLTNVSGTVAWSSSDNNVATVDASGVVTGVGMGLVTITATVDGVEGTIDLSFYPNKSELTIAEAVALCETLGGSNNYEYKVTGNVESIDTEYSAQYDNITVTITDGTDSIQAYRLAGGATLEVGAKIQVSGKLTVYQGTPQFAQGSTYENAIDSNILTQLEAVEAFMSLAYSYDVFQEEEAVAAVSDVAKYSDTTTTTNMTAGNQAEIIGLDSAKYTVTATKNSPTNNIGLNKAGEIRLYAHSSSGNGNELLIESQVVIESIEIEFGSTVGTFTVNGTTGAEETTTYTINSKSVAIKNTTSGASTQVHIKSITINCQAGTSITETYDNGEFRIRFGAAAALAELATLEGVTECGIVIAANGTVKECALSSLTLSEDKYYTVISLGDLFDVEDRFAVEFTVAAYVVIDGVTYAANNETNVKTYSVASMINEYYAAGYEVDHLYDVLSSKGYIA